MAISNISVFAASGFEAIINVPLGLSIGVPTGTYEALSDKGKVGFDSGVTAQIGYMIGIGNWVLVYWVSLVIVMTAIKCIYFSLKF